jgi:hypothetical protein
MSQSAQWPDCRNIAITLIDPSGGVVSVIAYLHHFDPEHSCESLGSREKQQTACEQRKTD